MVMSMSMGGGASRPAVMRAGAVSAARRVALEVNMFVFVWSFFYNCNEDIHQRMNVGAVQSTLVYYLDVRSTILFDVAFTTEKNYETCC